MSASLAHGEKPSPFHSRKRMSSWLILIMVMDVEGSGVTSSFQSMPIRVKPILQSAFPVTSRVGPWGQERRKSLPDFDLSEILLPLLEAEDGDSRLSFSLPTAGQSLCSSSH